MVLFRPCIRSAVSSLYKQFCFNMSRQVHVSFKVGANSVTPDRSDISSSGFKDRSVSSATSRSSPEIAEPRPRVSVAIVVIGDEILKGQVMDANSHYLAERMTAVGAQVRRITVIPDNTDAICKEIRELSTVVRWVVAAGGIGPTHDDMTYEGIAKAFDLELEKNEILISLLRQHLQRGADVELTLAEEKLATVPSGSTILFGDIREENPTEDNLKIIQVSSKVAPEVNQASPKVTPESIVMKPGTFPVVQTENVLILPGIPILLKRAFNSVKHLFECPDGAMSLRTVYSKIDELSFAHTLKAIAESHRPNLIIGSYPDLSNNYYRVKVTFESEYPQTLETVINQFVTEMPDDSVILDKDMPEDVIAEAEERVYNFQHSSSELCSRVADAIKITETAVKQYGQDGIAICFTGGKDCTVVLHILYAVLKRLHPDQPTHLVALQLSGFEPFPEVEQFLDQTKQSYGYQFLSFVSPDMKESLKKFVEEYPKVKAVFMGTRRQDPSASKLTSIQKTDAGWPELMRVSPILDFSYSDVWNFIRSLYLPYCSLYDKGYTSLGNPATTHPNRMLLSRSESTSLLRYRPAYELEDEGAERAGRDAHVPLKQGSSGANLGGISLKKKK